MSPSIELLRQLIHAQSGSAELDEAIACQLGYAKNGQSWTRPDGAILKSLPKFTTEVQAALDLAMASLKPRSGGLSWEQGLASAAIDGGKIYQARSPACALCIATIATLITTTR